MKFRLLGKGVLLALLCTVFIACQSAPPPSNWDDAFLLASARAELEQLRRELADMEYLSRQVSDRIDFITDRLIRSIERGGAIEDLFREIDQFVRDLIAENNRLRNIQ